MGLSGQKIKMLSYLAVLMLLEKTDCFVWPMAAPHI